MTGRRLHDALEIGQNFDLDLGLRIAAGGRINESNWPGCSQQPSFQRSRAPAMAPAPLELERRPVWPLDSEGHALGRRALSIRPESRPESRPTAAEARSGAAQGVPVVRAGAALGAKASFSASEAIRGPASPS